jgi:hypothetical protein
MCLGDLAETLTSVAIVEDSNAIDVEWSTADMSSFQAGATHACAHPFDDEIPLQLGDGTDDDDNGSPQRAASIQVFTEADELDVEVVELVQHFEEVADGSGNPIRSPDQHNLETTAARIPKQVIEARAPSFGSGDPIGILANDLKTSLLGHRTKIVELCFGMLVDAGYTQIKGNSLHICSLSEATTSCK